MRQLEWNANRTKASYPLAKSSSDKVPFAEVYQSTMIDENAGRWCVFFEQAFNLRMRWFDSQDEAYLFVEATFALEVL
jgi:hypothetical protein